MSGEIDRLKTDADRNLAQLRAAEETKARLSAELSATREQLEQGAASAEARRVRDVADTEARITQAAEERRRNEIAQWTVRVDALAKDLANQRARTASVEKAFRQSIVARVEGLNDRQREALVLKLRQRDTAKSSGKTEPASSIELDLRSLAAQLNRLDLDKLIEVSEELNHFLR